MTVENKHYEERPRPDGNGNMDVYGICDDPDCNCDGAWLAVSDVPPSSSPIEIATYNSAGIRSVAAEMGLTHMCEIARSGEGDERVVLFELGPCRVIDTNADPVWEDADPEAFHALLKAAGIDA